MKKYIKPEMLVMNLQHQNILCTSDFFPYLQGENVPDGWSKEISDIDIPAGEEW